MIEFNQVALENPSFTLDIPSLRIETGRPTVLVGKNGSGKSTLMETLLGLRPVTRGDIRIEGAPAPVWLKNPANKLRLGVQLQSMSYPIKTRVAEVVGFHKILFQGRHSEKIAKRLDISAIANRYYEQLSRGEKQRVDLYIALAHDPDLILLDEPTTGLDASFVEQALELISDVAQRADKIVLFASHIAREVQLAEELVRIEAGRVSQEPLAAHMAARLGNYCGELSLGAAEADQILAAIHRLPSLKTARMAGRAALMAFGEGEQFKTAFLALAESWSVAGHTLRLVDYNDLLKDVSCQEAWS